MSTIKNVWVGVFLAALLSLVLSWPAAHKCEHCGKPAYWDALLAHVIGDGYSIICIDSKPIGFIHYECLDEWLKNHPLEFDEDGRLINVNDPRHSSNK